MRKIQERIEHHFDEFKGEAYRLAAVFIHRGWIFLLYIVSQGHTYTLSLSYAGTSHNDMW